MKIIKKYALNNNNHFGRKNREEYITVHQTGNTDIGADAHAHANYMMNGSPATWHFTVSDDTVVQHYPTDYSLWHAGDGSGTGNLHSIGIELCINRDGDYNRTVETGAKLVEYLMRVKDIPLNRVVQHNRWSGKDCPRQIRAGKNGYTWERFLNLAKNKPSDTFYRVVIGSYKDRNNADEALRLANDKGFTDAFILLFKV